MSRRKDRERVEAMRREHPDYPGFRGPAREPNRRSDATLQAIVCSLCGRQRNVLIEVAQREGAKYVCLACQEKKGMSA